MSSPNNFSGTTTSGYADIREMKKRINISDSESDANNKLETYAREADTYINTQVGLHVDDSVPIDNPDKELISLASSYGCTIYNFWGNPDANDTIQAMKHWEKKIQEHIMAKYARRNPTGVQGKNSYGKTSGFKT